MGRKGGLNLDQIFGNIYNNLVGEPITPQKVAIFYLIKQMFRSHFGYRAVPSTRQFTPREKTRIFAVLFGLISLENEISYEDFRRVVRMLDKEVRRGIYYNFVMCMEKISIGEEHVDLRVEDSLYTGKREYHELAVYELPLTKPLMFLNTKAYVYIWIKRIMVQWIRSTQEDIYTICEKVRQWLLPKSNPYHMNLLAFRPQTHLPYEIDCSTRARIWITKHIQLLQVSPSQAMPFHHTIGWCELIKKKHPDVFIVHLLEAVVRVYQQDPTAAIRSIKTFFDFQMLKINDNIVNASQTHKLAVPCQRPLRYAPLLHGRVCRLFGDFRTAQTLLSECVQQSQIKMDETCNRMANIELTACEVLRSGPILEVRKDGEKIEPDMDKRIIQQNLHRGAEMDEHTNPEAFPQDPEEGYELHEQLVAMAKHLCVLDDILFSRYCIKSSENMETGLRVTSCSDHARKAQQVDDTAMSISNSNLMRNGMYQQAKRTSETLLNNNFIADWMSTHETEAFAIAGVNLAYSHASCGEFHLAFSVLEKLDSKFNMDINWMSARHVKICRMMISFEHSFLCGRLNVCMNLVNMLQTVSSFESTIRRALVLASLGQFNEAILLLVGYKCNDALSQIRIGMQLASIYTNCGRLSDAETELDKCISLAHTTTLRQLRAMITRRAANVLICRRKYPQALRLLLSIRQEIEVFANITETILYNFAIGRVMVNLVEGDPTFYLAKARALSVKCGWIPMQKLVLCEIAKYYDQTSQFELRDVVINVFAEIDDEMNDQISWMIV